MPREGIRSRIEVFLRLLGRFGLVRMIDSEVECSRHQLVGNVLTLSKGIKVDLD